MQRLPDLDDPEPVVNLLVVLQPHEDLTAVDLQLRHGSYRHTPGRWDVVERKYDQVVTGALPRRQRRRGVVAFRYRLRPADSAARAHARAAVARAHELDRAARARADDEAEG